jgi:hypothetical protein
MDEHIEKVLSQARFETQISDACWAVIKQFRPAFRSAHLKISDPELSTFNPDPLSMEVTVIVWQAWAENGWDIYAVFEEFFIESGVPCADPQELANWLKAFLEETLEKRRKKSTRG